MIWAVVAQSITITPDYISNNMCGPFNFLFGLTIKVGVGPQSTSIYLVPNNVGLTQSKQ